MICPAYLIEGLEQQFREIESHRMQGLPLLNPALQVKAVGFCEWNNHCLGVLITPWFMNLMLIPHEGDSWKDRQLGEKELHHLPSGPYEFILGEEEGIGRYQMCSLFSPVFEFADQETAVETAEQVMLGLMDEKNHDGISTRESEITRRWQGETEEEAETNTDNASEDQSPGISKRLQQPLTRRELLGRAIDQDSEQ
ncbi:MAG: [NiFe]-hydrogenase assembly chaperone HybE [Candidatus Thiodiazotropha sp. L084R]